MSLGLTMCVKHEAHIPHMRLTCLIWVFSSISPPVALIQAEMYIAVHVQCPHFLTDYGETWNICMEGKWGPHYEDSRLYHKWETIFWRKSLLRCVGHDWHKVHVCRLDNPSVGSWYTGENVRGSSSKDLFITCLIATKMTACVGNMVVSALGICHKIATVRSQKLTK